MSKTKMKRAYGTSEFETLQSLTGLYREVVTKQGEWIEAMLERCDALQSDLYCAENEIERLEKLVGSLGGRTSNYLRYPSSEGKVEAVDF